MSMYRFDTQDGSSTPALDTRFRTVSKKNGRAAPVNSSGLIQRSWRGGVSRRSAGVSQGAEKYNRERRTERGKAPSMPRVEGVVSVSPERWEDAIRLLVAR